MHAITIATQGRAQRTSGVSLGTFGRIWLIWIFPPDQEIIPPQSLLQLIQAAILAEELFQYFGGRVYCSQVGYFNPGKIRLPALILSPARENPRGVGRRRIDSRDDVATITCYLYQKEFERDAGLFGDGTRLKGILDMAEEVKTFLEAQHFSGVTLSNWVNTEYLTYRDHNFEMISEVRLTFTYRLRGALYL